MGFLDKVKSGLNDAGNKAKILVDVNRLKLQNSSKRKEIEEIQQQIGQLVFEAAVGRRVEVGIHELQPKYDRILELELEIQENKAQINALSDEKECVCGKTAPLEAKFCSSCGRTFDATPGL